MNETGKFLKIICDGAIAAAGEVNLSPDSRIVSYGEGCFDTLRAYCGGLIRPDRHLERLHRGMGYLGLDIPQGLQDNNAFLDQLKQLLEANDGFDEEVRIRVQVWADDHTSGYHPGNRSTRYVITGSVIAKEATVRREADHTGAADNFGPDCETTGITFPANPDNYVGLARTGTLQNPVVTRIPPYTVSLITSRYRRISSAALPANVKWSNGINFILAAREAAEKNADDALMLTSEGFVSETTIANIFWKSGDTVFTPSDRCDLLPGVTRTLTLDVLEDNGYQVQAGEFRLQELMNADTVWLCNSIREWYPVGRIDNHRFALDQPFWTALCNHLQRRKEQEMYYVH